MNLELSNTAGTRPNTGNSFIIPIDGNFGFKKTFVSSFNLEKLMYSAMKNDYSPKGL